MKKLIFTFCFIALTATLINGQEPFCDANLVPVSPAVPLPTVDNNAKYQAHIERNPGKKLNPEGTEIVDTTEEIIEYFDGENNIGISSELVGTNRLRTYSLYNTNEFLVFFPSENSCVKYDLTSDLDQISFFSPFPLVDGNGNSSHILSPLNTLFNNPNFKFVYIGESQVRGIPVNQWQTCIYSRFKLAYFNITASFSNPKKWLPAAFKANASNAFESVPVEIKVITKEDITDITNTVFYSITEFKPFLTLDAEEYNTPSGAYCKGRKNLKPLPSIPDSFRFSVQAVEPSRFSNDGGRVFHIYEEFNYREKLFRQTFVRRERLTSEIHDYNTGLKYIIQEDTGKCETRVIDSNFDFDADTTAFDIKLKDPSSFFRLDNETFQWTGFRQRDGVNCDVWIGPTNFTDRFPALIEWYFMADGWNRTDLDSYFGRYRIPIFGKFYINIPQPNSTQVELREQGYHFVDFRPTFFNPTHFDITKCDCSERKAHWTFKLPKDDNLFGPVTKNLDSFIQHTVRILAEGARVTVLRIADMHVYKDQSNVLNIFFTIYPRSNFYGNVPELLNDLDSYKAFQTLNASFLADKIQIEFWVDENNDFFTIPVDTNSLRYVDSDDYDGGQYFLNNKLVKIRSGEIEITKNKDQSKKASIKTVAIFSSVGVIVGLAVGAGFVILEKNNKIKIFKRFY